MPDPYALTAAALQRARIDKGWSARRLAREAVDLAAYMGEDISLTQQAVSQFENLKLKTTPRWVKYAETALQLADLPAHERIDLLKYRFGRSSLAPEVPPAAGFQLVTLQVALPSEAALARMFVGLLSGMPGGASMDEQAQLLARRLPIGLSQLRDLLPAAPTVALSPAEAPAMLHPEPQP